MSAIQCYVEVEKYFKTNWTATSIHLDGEDFTNDNYDAYIRLHHVNNGSDLVGLQNHQEFHGFTQVFCYHRRKKLSVKMSDDIKILFDNKDLIYDIHSKTGQQYATEELENGYFVTLVQFKIEQYT